MIIWNVLGSYNSGLVNLVRDIFFLCLIFLSFFYSVLVFLSAIYRENPFLALWRCIALFISIAISYEAFKHADLLHLAVIYPSIRTQISRAHASKMEFPFEVDTGGFVSEFIVHRTLIYDTTYSTQESVKHGRKKFHYPGSHRYDGEIFTERLIGNFYLRTDVTN
jgi:hypothetical protein